VAEVGTQLVRELREKTGAGIMDCKQALQHVGGDLAAAADWLRERGLAAAAKKAGRVAEQGTVVSYVHPGGRVGVLLELNCETDFVALNEGFQALARDLALQVAATAPRYVAREDVPADVLAHESDILRRQAQAEGRPERVIDRVVEGRLAKFYGEQCLLEQAFIKDEDRQVSALVQEAISRFGENIVVRRFARFALGEGAGGESE
jgi:elongation factor Ts